MSSLFLRTLREDPVEAEVASHKLLIRAGYIRRAAPGIYSYLPLGLRLLRKIEAVIAAEMDAAGAQQLHFPALLPKEPFEATGRWEEYGPGIFRLQDRKGADYLLAPTHEEMFTLMVKDLYTSYKDLPVTLYQIQTKYRDEARPRAGLLRGREFVMKDAYSFDVDAAGLENSYQKQRAAYIRIFERLGLPYVIVAATAGAMGGSKSEEFLTPTEIGEDTYVRSPGGYAANVEAVTTLPPAPLQFDTLAPAETKETPNAGAIADLIMWANANAPRDDRPWEAADALKHVVVAVSAPTGEREVIVVAIPGDRELDLVRLAAALAPAEVTPATDADFAAHPELVKGFLGPEVLQPQNPAGVRYFVDPRVVTGTSWIVGANTTDAHIFGAVYGRDFTALGTIEAAEVRAGDPAPDGSGPLELARGVEIGHIFQLGEKYAAALGLQVLDERGKQVTVTMGSYGIGVTRVLALLAELNHDELGLKWPAQIAPYQIHIVATGKDSAVFVAADELAAKLEAAGWEVCLDDREKVSPGVKFKDAELLGAPVIVVVGKSYADGLVEVRDRRTDARQTVTPEELLATVSGILA